MSSVRDRRPPVKPVQPPRWFWIQKPLWPCVMFPQGLPGMIGIDDQLYMLTVFGDVPEEGPPLTRGYRLTKSDGTTYDIPADLQSCDCADCTFRRRQCKHILAVRQALASIGYNPDPEPPTPAPTAPKYRSLGDMARNDPAAYERWQAECA